MSVSPEKKELQSNDYQLLNDHSTVSRNENSNLLAHDLNDDQQPDLATPQVPDRVNML